MQDFTAFVAQARAKLSALTGAAPSEQGIKVGDRVRYSDSLNCVGKDKGYVTRIEDGKVWYTLGYIGEDHDPAELLEVNPWIAWHGGSCPVDENQLVEVKFADGKSDEDAAGAYRTGCWSWGTTDLEIHIVAYRVLVK